MRMRWKSIKQYWPLFKSLQTLLLTVTGVAGFMSARCPIQHWSSMVALVFSLLFAIAGSTVLNMWYDRDIDSVMNRTHHRPLAQGKIPPRNALVLGLVLSILGVGIGFILAPLYSLILLLGIVFDFLVYTVWLKRRTCWSIIWGGIAGGMPILAGRVLGMGQVDVIGILLMLSVLFWIPTHILTFSIHYAEDYAAARIPTFPSTYGVKFTRNMVVVSTIIAAALITSAAILIQVSGGFLHLLGILSGALVMMALFVMFRPSRLANFSLFKYASVYMLAAMLLLAF